MAVTYELKVVIQSLATCYLATDNVTLKYSIAISVYLGLWTYIDCCWGVKFMAAAASFTCQMNTWNILPSWQKHFIFISTSSVHQHLPKPPKDAVQESVAFAFFSFAAYILEFRVTLTVMRFVMVEVIFSRLGAI